MPTDTPDAAALLAVAPPFRRRQPCLPPTGNRRLHAATPEGNRRLLAATPEGSRRPQASICPSFSTVSSPTTTAFSSNIVDMDSAQSQNTSLQRLQGVEKRTIRVLELAGGVMDELANPVGPRKDLLNNHCGEFMKLIKDIQVTLREEIKSACEYRPFEKCDYGARLSNEVSCKKLEYILSQLDSMKQTIDEYNDTQG